MRCFQRSTFSLLFLTAFILSTSAWSLVFDGLSGNWYHDGQSTSIRHNGFGNQYLFCNESGNCANGSLTSPNSVQVISWGVVGFLSHRNQEIRWSNGTKWIRHPHDQMGIDGQWFHNNRQTYIQVNENSQQFTITNEEGQSSWGYIQGRILVIPSLHITGRILGNGNAIHWSNNTTWIR